MAIYLGSTRLDGAGSGTTITGDGIVAVASLADLTGLTPADGDAIQVLGHTSKNDGGGGLYVWNASAADNKMLSGATVSAGGTGYEVGDLVWIVGGTYGVDQAFVRVATVSGSVVATVSIVYKGNYSTTPGTTSIATTSRDGINCTLNLTWASFSNYGTYIPKAAGGTGRWTWHGDTTGRVSVKVFGAKGDGATDDWLAIQRAIWSYNTLFFPEGTYNVSEALTFLSERAIDIAGSGSREGWGTSTINFSKNTDEPMIHPFGRYMKSNGAYQFETGYEVGGNNLGGVVGSRFNLKDIKLYSAASIYGSCCEMTLIGQGLFKNVGFYSNFRGLTLGQATFDITVSHCSFVGNFMGQFPWASTTGGESNKTIARRAWGLHAAGHTFIYGCVAVGNGCGFRLTGTGIAFSGARIEVNNYGILISNALYALESEYVSKLSRSHISGISLEANTIGFEVDDMADSTITGIGIQGSAEAPPRPQGEIGFHLKNMSASCTVNNIAAGGRFIYGSLLNQSRHPIQNSLFWGETIAYARTNSIFGVTGGQPSFRVSGFENEVGALTSYSDLMLKHLSGLNLRDGQVMGRNFGDVARPGSGVTSFNVTFTPAIGYTIYAFDAFQSYADGGSTLAAGTYYYATTLVGKHAESGINYSNATIHSHRTAVLPATSGMWMSFYGGASSWLRRRVYRTSVNAPIGSFEGYFEMVGTAADFYDNGQAFTRRGQPPEDGEIPSCVEADANYRVIVTPSWGTTTWVTNIATTGFTINFGTATPDVNQSVSWLIFRP